MRKKTLPVMAALMAGIIASPVLADPPINVVIHPGPYSTALDEPVNDVPENVQVVTPRDVQDQDDRSVGDLLLKNIDGVNVNDTAGNPFQPDVNYHGFTASPLLGTPVGLSVYQDGVRVNEPFGDVVNWDLIPQNAVSSATLVPGSDPLYGLNTLGGAIAVQTKTGLTDPGSHVETYGGSWGRRAVEAENGGAMPNGLNWFVAGTDFAEDGWRDASPSRVRQAFGKVAWQGDKADFALTFTGADNFLAGLGYAPQSLLDTAGNASVYTAPDTTRNRLAFLTAKGGYQATKNIYISSIAYVRAAQTQASNGDVNDDYDDASDYPHGNVVGGLDFNESATTEGRTQENGTGIEGQAAFSQKLFDRNNQFIAGASYDYAGLGFDQTYAEGSLNADRAAINNFASVQQVDLHGHDGTLGLFATDNFEVLRKTHLTLSGRYNDTSVSTSDSLTPSGPGSLAGSQTFRSFNPAIGLTHDFSDALNIYGGFNQGSRAPSSVEIGCSDPANPCALPNALAGDPPRLKQVIADTVEGGLRGRLDGNVAWNLGAYRTTSHEDIQFIASNVTGDGYFTNVGQTRRQGVDAGIAKTWDRFKLSAGYSLVDTTYQSSFQIANDVNSSSFTNAGGTPVIQVGKGDRIPGIPEHQFKLRGEWQALRNWTIGGDLLAFSSQYAHGDENNADPSGKIGGYAVVDLDTRYTIADTGWQIFASIDNLFNTHYRDAGLLGENNFTPNGAFRADGGTTTEPFFSPGAPLAAWVGVSWRFGGPRSARNENE